MVVNLARLDFSKPDKDLRLYSHSLQPSYCLYQQKEYSASVAVSFPEEVSGIHEQKVQPLEQAPKKRILFLANLSDRLLLYCKNICKACNIKDLHYGIAYVNNFHFTLL